MAAARHVPLLLFAFIACGDIPHPAARVWSLPDATSPAPDAATLDGSIDDTGAGDTGVPDAGPKRPLPVSDQCLLCGAAPCYDFGSECVGDPFCQSCFADVYAPGCLQDKRFVDMGRCVCTHCFDTCRDVCEPTRSTWDTLPESGPPGGG